jgi:hypothetical protein
MTIEFPMGLQSYNETSYENITNAMKVQLKTNEASNATLTKWVVNKMTSN